MANFTALYDACVLYPAQLRDLLIRLAKTELFRARWTDQIHEEWIQHLVKDGHDPVKLARTRQLMDAAVPDCLITGYERLVPTLELPDPGDRHVLAAAIVGRADLIVTANLSDFPATTLEQYGMEAQHPDDFFICQFELSPPRVCEQIKKQRENLRKPPRSLDEFLDSLARLQLPQTVQKLKEYAPLL